MSIQTDDFTPAPRVVSATPVSPKEEAIERALRPKLLDEYVGQQKVREQLEIFIGAARKRSEALDHVLLFGPPGLGKTTLSHIIAQELGVNLRQTSGPVLEKPRDLAALLTNLEPNDVLFIDEIHRLSPVVEEILYPALEDYQIDIMIGEGPAARSIKLDLQPFTLVGATTRAGMLTNPLRDRFGIVARLEGVVDRSGAEALKGARIHVPRSAFPAAADGEYYWVDLIGLDVVNREGVHLGVVRDLIPTGPTSVLVMDYTETVDGVEKTAERMVPFVAAYIDDVDLNARRITADWQTDY